MGVLLRLRRGSYKVGTAQFRASEVVTNGTYEMRRGGGGALRAASPANFVICLQRGRSYQPDFRVMSTLFPITPPSTPPIAAPMRPPLTLSRLVVAPRTAPAAAPIAASRWVCFSTTTGGVAGAG